ncbi:MAG: MogA/MoaB family molybdenum cofactor biosynthesis protein [Acidobacteria bacterium]|nr:MogA/MoaB family molybdenum cofactor biosynthesis protein [Acidobacteriota bacterium]
MMRVIVLTISDGAAAGARQDLSGPAVERLCLDQGWSVLAIEVLPDEQADIARRLAELADDAVAELVVTTGGTGVAARDVTPEATRSVIEKELPGLAELMRAEGLKKTRRAALSRGLAGVRGRTLVVNVPGSPKGAVESLNAILDLVPHVVDLLQGRTEHREESKRG